MSRWGAPPGTCGRGGHWGAGSEKGRGQQLGPHLDLILSSASFSPDAFVAGVLRSDPTLLFAYRLLWDAQVTPLMEWLSSPAAVDNQVICLNLRNPCWTMAMLSVGASGASQPARKMPSTEPQPQASTPTLR